MSSEQFAHNSGRGRFVVFEGIDGSGKSTQSMKLATRLLGSGFRVHLTREPSDGPVGSMIRQAMTGRVPLDDKVIAGLFVADRIDHLVNEVDGILKLLDQGITVISDRYYFSSLAYHAEFLDLDWIFAANSEAKRLLRADLTLFVDVPPEAAVGRIKSARHRFEKYEEVGRLGRVKEAYVESFSRFSSGERIQIIDGDREPSEVHRQVWHEVQRVLSI